MTAPTRGERIRERRVKLGMSVKGLAEQAGVDRATLTAIENGASARPSTFGAVEATLDRLDGRKTPRPGGTVTFHLVNEAGVGVTIEGPVEHLAELEASAARLVAQMRGASPGS